MISWFLSDIHLKDINERNGNRLLRFLFELKKNPKEHQIFLLGDIFDLWISDGISFVKPFELLVKEIVDFKNQGGRVYYFEGNHDVHIDHYWTKYHDIAVFDDKQYMKIDNLMVRIEHGDYINPNDTAYLKYLSIIRNPWVEKIGIQLPSHFWAYVAGKQSVKSRKRSSRYTENNSENIRQMIRRYARKAYAEQPFDLLITGHMHVFDDESFEVGVKKVRSINLGTWLDKPRVLKIQNSVVEVIDLDQMLDG